MKNLYILVISCVLALQVQAQFTLNPRTATTQGPNTATKTSSSVFTNNAATSADSIFGWMMIENTTPQGWTLSICDPLNCWASVGMNQEYAVKILKGQTGVFKIDFDFDGVSGDGIVRMAIYSKTTSATDTLTLGANSWTTGMNDVNRAASFSFYPNPIKDQLNFKYTSNSPVAVDIYNILGVKVKSFIHDGNLSQVNVSDLQKGVYFIRLKNASGATFSKSFTKSE